MTSQPLPVTPWRRRAKRVAIALGVVLTCAALLCCAGVAYLAYNVNRAPDEEREMETFATELCRDLLARDADAIYVALSEDAQDRYTVKGLADGLAARKPLTHCVVDRAAWLFLLVAYVVISDANGQHSFELVKEGDLWKVASDILDDLDKPSSHGGGGFGD